MKVHASLQSLIEAAQAAGLTVRAPGPKPWYREAGHVYVTQEGKPGIALIQVSSFPSIEPPSIDVPVKPSRVYGNLVTQDYWHVTHGVTVLLGLMERDTCVPRFVGPHGPVPVDYRVPEDAEPCEF